MRTSIIGLTLGAALSSTSIMSCVDNDSSVYVEGVLALTAPGCEAVNDPGATQRFRGTLDVAFTRDYNAPILVANQLTPRGSKNQLRTETQGLALEGAEVLLTDAAGDFISEFSVPTGGFVHVSRAETPGYGVAMVTLVPPSVGADMLERLEPDGRGASTTVIASVRVFGTTLGGVEITSGAFTFPIDICYGCLIAFPLDAVENQGNGLTCVGGADTAPGLGCIPGQDEQIDCRQCAATLRICEVP